MISRISNLWWALVVVVGPQVLLLAHLTSHGRGPVKLALRDQYLTLSLVLLAGGALALAGPGWARARARSVAWLLAGGAGLVALSLVWSVVFTSYVDAGGVGHIVRSAFLTSYRAPFYGVAMRPEPVWAWATFALAALFVAWTWARAPRATSGARAVVSWVVVLGVLQVAATIAVAQAESPFRLLGRWASYAAYASYTDHFDGALHVLRAWVDTMPRLEGFARHYPPGIAMLLEPFDGPVAMWRAKIVFIVVPAFSAIPMLGIARELGLSDRAACFSVLAFALSPTLWIYPTLSPTPALVLPATMAMWMLARGLFRGGFGAPLAMGAWMAFFSLLSFAVYMVALPMGCLLIGALLTRQTSLARASSVVGLALVVFVGFFALLRAATGFDLVACLEASIRLTGVSAFNHAWAYVLRSTGGLLAYLVSVGFPLAVLAGLALARSRTPGPAPIVRVFIWSVAAGVLLGALSGRSYLETERIWLFYTPLLALLAGFELDHRTKDEGPIAARTFVLAMLTFGCTYALFMRHHLWRLTLG